MEEQRLTASDGTARDGFGWSMAVDGDVAVIGAPLDDDAGPRAGSAYVFRFNGTIWVEEQKLTAPDAAVLDHDIFFGASVAVDGDTIFVGGALDQGVDSRGLVTSTAGAAYVYRFNGTSWVHEQKLTARNPSAFDSFGRSVAVDGDTVVIGAPCGFGNDDCSMNSGAAYVLARSGGVWTEQAKLTVSGPTLYDDFFGEFVAVDGNTAVVGGAFDVDDEDAQTALGSPYVFVRSGGVWTEQAKLTVAGPGAVSFSQTRALDLDGDTVIVGSVVFGDDEFLLRTSVSANVFTRTGEAWTQQATLSVPDPAQDQRPKNISVSVDGNTAVVRAPPATFGDDQFPVSGDGSVYIFARTTDGWTRSTRLQASSGGAFDDLGGSLDVDGDTVLVGATGEDSSTGAAYVFDLGRCDADEDGLLNDWETNGIPYTDGNGIERRFMLPGADPLHKDLYVEVDAMTGFGLSDAAVMLLEEAFRKAPLSNPDGSDGITLHVFRDESDLDLDKAWDTGDDRSCWPLDFQALRDARYGTDTEGKDPNRVALLEAKSKAYRYCVVADKSGPKSYGGCGEISGDSFVVYFGSGTLTDEDHAAMFMHELGHSLGLDHGGGDDVNGKPNYPSIMNHVLSYRFNWNTAFWELDYSRADAGNFASLDESFLNERAGIGTHDGHYREFRMPFGVNQVELGSTVRRIKFLRLDGSTGKEQGKCVDPSTDFGDRAGTMFQDCDWNVGVQQDLNYTGNPTQPDIQLPGSKPSFSPPQTLYPYDDWANVSLPLAAALGDRAAVIRLPTDELTAEAREWIDANFPLPPVACLADLDGDGQSDLADFAFFARCMGGPGQPLAPGCQPADMDGDGDADLADFVTFQASFGCP